MPLPFRKRHFYSVGAGGKSSGTGIGRIRDGLFEAEVLLPVAIAVFGADCDLTVAAGLVEIVRRVGTFFAAGVLASAAERYATGLNVLSERGAG